jgi:hypothetical protein
LILRAGRPDWRIEAELQILFRDNTKRNLGFWGEMTGCLDFRVGKEIGVLTGAEQSVY